MRQKNRKIMAAGMAAVTLCTSLVSTPVYAAEASVSVDESMYVNLDYYGSVDKVVFVGGRTRWALRPQAVQTMSARPALPAVAEVFTVTWKACPAAGTWKVSRATRSVPWLSAKQSPQ